jgi:hypothetical protein
MPVAIAPEATAHESAGRPAERQPCLSRWVCFGAFNRGQALLLLPNLCVVSVQLAALVRCRTQPML